MSVTVALAMVTRDAGPSGPYRVVQPSVLKSKCLNDSILSQPHALVSRRRGAKRCEDERPNSPSGHYARRGKSVAPDELRGSYQERKPETGRETRGSLQTSFESIIRCVTSAAGCPVMYPPSCVHAARLSRCNPISQTMVGTLTRASIRRRSSATNARAVTLAMAMKLAE